MRSMRDRAGCVAALVWTAWMAGAQCPPGWRSLGCGLGTTGPTSIVRSVVLYDEDGAGPNPGVILAGGLFTDSCQLTFANAARWTGSGWIAVSAGATSGPNGQVRSLVVFDEDGPGPAIASLFWGGHFTSVDGMSGTWNIVRWNGAGWSAVGGGLTGGGSVNAIVAFDDDGAGPNPESLFVAGFFTGAGGASVSSIARWNGTSWSALGAGVSASVNALAVFDEDGAGPGAAALFAAGSITMAGGGPVSNIARWNGTSWSALGAGISGVVNALAVYDEDGAGPGAAALFAAGSFTMAGGAAVSNIARWDGSAWSDVGGGVSTTAVSLAVIEEGANGEGSLYVGGTFTSAGGMPASRIARWDGQSWSAVEMGTDGTVISLSAVEDGAAGPGRASLYVGGTYTMAGGLSARSISAYNRLLPPSIGQHPEDAEVTEGGTATFSAQAAGNYLSYRWRKDGVDVGGYPCSGADTPTLTISPAGAIMAGAYDCVVTSPCGSVVSTPAMLTVHAYCPQDANGDGRTDFLDLNLILSFFGQECPPAP